MVAGTMPGEPGARARRPGAARSRGTRTASADDIMRAAEAGGTVGAGAQCGAPGQLRGRLAGVRERRRVPRCRRARHVAGGDDLLSGGCVRVRPELHRPGCARSRAAARTPETGGTHGSVMKRVLAALLVLGCASAMRSRADVWSLRSWTLRARFRSPRSRSSSPDRTWTRIMSSRSASRSSPDHRQCRAPAVLKGAPAPLPGPAGLSWRGGGVRGCAEVVRACLPCP